MPHQPWIISMVYGPTVDERKAAFLEEISYIRSIVSSPWLIIGDFNLIKNPKDKNNCRVDNRWMARFRAALNSASLKEIPLIGRNYNWSNEQTPPTLVRVDRAFCTADWALRFPTVKFAAPGDGHE